LKDTGQGIKPVHCTCVASVYGHSDISVGKSYTCSQDVKGHTDHKLVDERLTSSMFLFFSLYNIIIYLYIMSNGELSFILLVSNAP